MRRIYPILILVAALSACGKTDVTPTCTDAILNGTETDVDCGGTCGACVVGKKCAVTTDCVSNICTGSICAAAPSCTDGIKNATETDLDCGGGACPACAVGKTCAVDTDCSGMACNALVCAAGLPMISSIAPASGPSTGGTTITITGVNFIAGSTVTVAGVAATNVNIVSATSITAVTPAKAGTTGKVAVVVTDPGTHTASNNTSFGYFYGTVSFATAVNTSTVAAGTFNQIEARDLDNDGALDLIVADSGTAKAVQIFYGNAAGTFAATPDKTLAFGAAGPKRFAIGNFDEDAGGLLDIAISDGTTGIGVYIQTPGTARGWPASVVAANTYTVGTTPLGIVAADLNHDNHIDLAVANNGALTISLLTNKAATLGTFNTAVTAFSVAANTPYTIASADLNKDGYNDLVVTNNGNASVSFSLQSAVTAGTFPAPTVLTAPGTTAGLSLADFDGDGNIDVMVGAFNGTQVSFFKGGAAGPSGNAVNTTLGAMGLIPFLASGDIDQDGKVDLIASSNVDGKAYVLINSTASAGGTLSFVANKTYATDTAPIGVAVGTFGKAGTRVGFGRLDIATANKTTASDISVLLNTSM